VAMHQKFGFEQEGLLRDHLLRDGERVDVHVLAMFAPTWADNRDAFTEKLRGRELIA